MTVKHRLRRGARWLPRTWAAREPYRRAEPMMGGTRRGVTLHDEGVARRCDRRHRWLAHYLNSEGIPYHLLWCPRCGWWCQLIPMTKAARSLKGGAVRRDGASVNKAGQVNIQICLVGIANGRDYDGRPVTARHLARAWILAEILDAHRIPARWPKHWGADANRSLRRWRASGIHGHEHSPAPGEDHTDPGDLDVARLVAVARRQQRRRR